MQRSNVCIMILSRVEHFLSCGRIVLRILSPPTKLLIFFPGDEILEVEVSQFYLYIFSNALHTI